MLSTKNKTVKNLSVISRAHSQERNRQTFSVKGQMVNVCGFASHQSVCHNYCGICSAKAAWNPKSRFIWLWNTYSSLRLCSKKQLYMQPFLIMTNGKSCSLFLMSCHILSSSFSGHLLKLDCTHWLLICERPSKQRAQCQQRCSGMSWDVCYWLAGSQESWKVGGAGTVEKSAARVQSLVLGVGQAVSQIRSTHRAFWREMCDQMNVQKQHAHWGLVKWVRARGKETRWMDTGLLGWQPRKPELHFWWRSLGGHHCANLNCTIEPILVGSESELRESPSRSSFSVLKCMTLEKPFTLSSVYSLSCSMRKVV